MAAAANPAAGILTVIEDQARKALLPDIKNALFAGKYVFNESKIEELLEHLTTDGKIIDNANFFITAIMYNPLVGFFIIRESRTKQEIDSNDYDNIFQKLQFWFDFKSDIFSNPDNLSVKLTDKNKGENIGKFGNNIDKIHFITKLYENISKSFNEFLNLIFNDEADELFTPDEHANADGVRYKLTEGDGIPYFLIGKYEGGNVVFYNNIEIRWFFMTYAERDKELNEQLRIAILAAVLAASSQSKDVDAQNKNAAVLAAILAASSQSKDVDAQNKNAAVLAAVLAASSQSKEVDAQNKNAAVLAAVLAASSQSKEVDAQNKNAAVLAAVLAASSQSKEVDAQNKNAAVLAAVLAASSQSKDVDAQNKNAAVLAAVLASMAGNNKEKEEEDAIRLFMESGVIYKTEEYIELEKEGADANTKSLEYGKEETRIKGQITENETAIKSNNAEIEKLQNISKNPQAEIDKLNGLIATEKAKIDDKTNEYNKELAKARADVAIKIGARIKSFSDIKDDLKLASASGIGDFINKQNDIIKKLTKDLATKETKPENRRLRIEKGEITKINTDITNQKVILSRLNQTDSVPWEEVKIDPLESRIAEHNNKIKEYQDALSNINTLSDQIKPLKVISDNLNSKNEMLKTELKQVIQDKNKYTSNFTKTLNERGGIVEDKDLQIKIKKQIVNNVKKMNKDNIVKQWDKSVNRRSLYPTTNVHKDGKQNNIDTFLRVFGFAPSGNISMSAQLLYEIYKMNNVDNLTETLRQQEKEAAERKDKEQEKEQADKQAKEQADKQKEIDNANAVDKIANERLVKQGNNVDPGKGKKVVKKKK